MLARALLPRRTTVRGVPVADLGLVAALLLVQTGLALSLSPQDGRTPGLFGWLLLLGMAFVLLFRRAHPWLTAIAVIGMAGPYHGLDYVHTAAVPAGLVALFSLAVAGPPIRTFGTLGVVLGIMSSVMLGAGSAHDLAEMLRGSGWLVAVVLVGEAVRIHRNYVAAIVERAERAERTREQEAARRVAEERLRIARDLHDLLAHSITLIGVQTSVAAHILVADPERLDRDAVAKSLDGIADTCRDARAELRTTLEVLRASDRGGEHVNGSGPLPGLSGIPDLVRAARGAGARVELAVRLGTDADGERAPGGPDGADARPAQPVAEPPPAVGAAIYRIVQEALTNAVRHAGPTVGVRVTVCRTRQAFPDGEGSGDGSDDGSGDGSGAPAGDADGHCDAVRLTVLDDGAPSPPPSLPVAGAADPAPEHDHPPGFGIVGMRERARSVGGTLDAAPRTDGPGFAVTAVLPLSATHPDAGVPATTKGSP
ncbi:sensor histidine kinase [Streptomyces armeniacus]|uniref:histidine kinase n=1 Tax=Streptomyces armeniacus TaxID=83291 RepID=A0A345Y0S3_9ACTN|nr:sensor histidine kinase [Streptomyces armeniacus]